MSTYSSALITTITHVLSEHPGTEFYLFRHPDQPVPPIRATHVIHRINDAVPPGQLFLVDKTALFDGFTYRTG